MRIYVLRGCNSFFHPKSTLHFTYVPWKFGFSHEGSRDVTNLKTAGVSRQSVGAVYEDKVIVNCSSKPIKYMSQRTVHIGQN
jgi:hypothetical protein